MQNVARGYENFSYFDQFNDLEIDLTKYLTHFSTDEYKLEFSNIQPVKTTVKNLFEQFKLIDDIKKNSTFFDSYAILDGERAEIVSYNFYGTVDYWWIVFIFNNIKNPFFDWPMTEIQLVRTAEYLSKNENRFPKQTYYDLLFEQNENKRNIILPKVGQIPNIIWAFRSEIIKNRKKK